VTPVGSFQPSTISSKNQNKVNIIFNNMGTFKRGKNLRKFVELWEKDYFKCGGI